MNTFLPYSDFVKSVKCLDNKRLVKQAVECYQLLMVKDGKGWSHHPAFLMWKNHKDHLKRYAIAICSENIARGFKCSVLEKIQGMEFESSPVPSWLGNEELHSKYRATLLFKDPKWYSQFGWSEVPKYGYKWPVSKN